MTRGHGTHADYVHGCRCSRCTAATAAYRSRLRLNERGGVGDLGWQDDAVCRGSDPALWYPPEPELVPDRCRAMCDRCVVRGACLAHAIAHEVDGVWASTSPRHREQARRRAGIRVQRPELRFAQEERIEALEDEAVS